MLRRVAAILGFLLGGVLLGVPLWIATHRADLPAPDDADLAIAAAPLAPADDGFEGLRAAARAVKELEDGDTDARLRAMRRRERSEPDLVAKLLRENAPALAALERGLSAPGMRIPEWVPGAADQEMLDPLFKAQLLVKLAATDAQLRLRAGDRNGTFDRALLGMRVARKLSEADGANLLSAMLAVACQGISLAEIESLVHEMSLAPAEARALSMRIGSQTLMSDGWTRVYATEYQFAKATMLEVDEKDPTTLGEDESPATRILRWIPRDYLWQPNRTLSLLASFYREQQRQAPLACQPEADAASEPSVSKARLLKVMLMPNPTGRLVVEIATPNFARFQTKRCYAETKVGLVRALLAIQAYVKVEGALPDHLDQLVPEYLDAVPMDRFGGRPLRYSKADAVVYSIGDDFADAGGSEVPSLGSITEPALRVAL